MMSNEVSVGGRWIRASKHMDGPCQDALDEVIRHIRKGVAMDEFFVMIGRMSIDVTIDGFVSLGSRGLSV
jgi:hypothetical protein